MDTYPVSGAAVPAVGVGARRLVCFREDVALERHDADLLIAHRWGSHPVPDVPAGLLRALDRLTFGPTRPANVVDLVISAADDPAAALALLYKLLDRLQCLLVHSVEIDSATAVELVPIAASARLDIGRVGPIRLSGAGLDIARLADADLVRLSRFAYLHQVDGALELESPLSDYRARLLDPRLATLVASAAQPCRVGDLCGPAVLPDGRGARPVLELLVAGGLLTLVDPDESAQPAARARRDRLRQWDFHDLLFHTRSRSGRHDEESGATFTFLGELEPEGPVRELPPGPQVPLPIPDLAAVRAAEPGLTSTLETRRTVREPGAQPLDLAQLGELLYRSARTRAVRRSEQHWRLPYHGVDKPYPAFVGAGELDVWLTVHRCTDLAGGIYYYDPVGHRLVLVNSAQSDVDALLGGATVASGATTPPDVLLTVTARFQRLGWAYRGISYATTLKHVGVFYQTLYLVCTAMGLAPCGLAVGDIELAARALRLDWTREGSVGEFMVSAASDRPVAD
jgi:SagB-type dehydrogenase family enzyme